MFAMNRVRVLSAFALVGVILSSAAAEAWGPGSEDWTEIEAKWEQIGSPQKARPHPEQVGDGWGDFLPFAGGMILWNPRHRAHEMHGEIYKRWRADGGVSEERAVSVVGYPINDEQLTEDGGAFNVFETQGRQRSAIFWHPATGAFRISGSIYTNWRRDQGYPVASEEPADPSICPGRDRQQRFQRMTACAYENGAVSWVPSR